MSRECNSGSEDISIEQRVEADQRASGNEGCVESLQWPCFVRRPGYPSDLRFQINR